MGATILWTARGAAGCERRLPRRCWVTWTFRPGPRPIAARPGPRLSEPAERLSAALQCSGALEGALRTPVLLVHGTGLTPEENWSASYSPALSWLGIPWCTVALPERATGDIQASAEYVVHAIREMSRRAARRIAVIAA